MLFPSVFSRLVLAVLILALSNNIQSAPTHHLTIGVQGNTPTLMVTSSEIGITTQTMDFSKKPAKVLYAAKTSKDTETPKKPLKSKFNKSQALNNKKDKLQHLTKHQFKHELNKEQTPLEHKQLSNNNETLKSALNKNFAFNGEDEMESSTEMLADSTSPKNVDIYETNLQVTTLPSNQTNEMLLMTSITPQVVTTTAKSPEEISTLLPPTTADTSSLHIAITDNDNFNISPAMSTTLSPKDLTTLNNNADTNTATTNHTLTQTQMRTTTGANDVVLQTQKTTQISTETSIIKMANEDDNDRYKQDSIAFTDNENLLLTTIETNAFTAPITPTEISTPSTNTFKINNAEATTTTEMLALSLIMTTTDNVADDSNNGESQDEKQQQQQQTKKSHKNINGPEKSIGGEGEDIKPIKQEHQKDKDLFKPEQEYMSATTTMQQFKEEIKSTANPIPTTQETKLNARKSTATENKIQTESIGPKKTTTSIQYLPTTENEQQSFVTLKANPEYHATTITTKEPETTPASTTASTKETILKLIDLEKHVLKTIDDLKQLSVLMVTQHDNGHDGLKTTKKKQLIDKHYVEALLHHKQDHHQRKETHEHQVSLNTQPTFSTNSSKAIKADHKPLLMPIEHGSLGPILMQEKTFHVMHQDANSRKIKKHLEEGAQSHLRRGHFVELKAKPTGDENKKYKEILFKKDMENVSKVEVDIRDMQSDQPAENFSQQNVQEIDPNKGGKNLKKTQQNFKNLEDVTSEKEDLNGGKRNSLTNATSEINRKLENVEVFQESNSLKETSEVLESPKAKNHFKNTPNKGNTNLKKDTVVKQTLEISNKKLKPTSNGRHQELSTESSLQKPTNKSDNEKDMEADKKWKNVETSETPNFELQPTFDEKHQPEESKTILKNTSYENNRNLVKHKDIKEKQNSQIIKKAFDSRSEDPQETSDLILQKTADGKYQQTRSETTVSSNNNDTESKLKEHEIKAQNSGLLKKAVDTLFEVSALQLKQTFSGTQKQTESTSSLKIENEDFDKLSNDTNFARAQTSNLVKALKTTEQKHLKTHKASFNEQKHSNLKNKPASVLSSTVFQIIETMATKTPLIQADTLFSAQEKEKTQTAAETETDKQQTESKISDIQIEVYDSTIDSIVASTNFKDNENKQQISLQQNDENYLGKTTKPPIAAIQQERFTQYVIDRTETSTPEPINFNTIKVASGKPEPAAIEIHINVSESFGNESEDLEFSYPQTEFISNQQIEKIGEESYDENKVSDKIKLQIPSYSNGNAKDLRNDEVLVVEIIDTENNATERSLKEKPKRVDELFISDIKQLYTTPPPPPPPPPYQANFDRDSDTIFYISNTEVKVGESLPSAKNINEERKLKLESQFFPANYMASTHPNFNNNEDRNLNANHHLFEEDIILSSNRNQADSLKIYRNDNEPSPPLDVTYVGESIIEVEQSPDTLITTTYAPEQIHNMATPQADVIIQPAILPEISIGVPVIGELPPQIELKEIDFMPNEAQLHRSGIYDDNDNSNSNNNDIDDNTITGSSSNNNHDADIVSSNSNSNQHIEESSIQYGGDLIDESADGGFDGVEGSYPFGNPALVKKSSFTNNFFTKLQKQQQQQQQQPNHVADYAHLYVNYGVNNMRKDELTADIKNSGEIFLNGNVGNGNVNIASNEQNTTTFKDFLSKVSMSNSTMPFTSANATQNERMSNATAFSVMDNVNDLEDRNTENIINLISLAIGLFIVILPVVVTCSMFWALRYLYKKYHSNLMDSAGYADQNERKIPLNDEGAEKGEFFHEPFSSPTNCHKDTLEKYPDTSNKPSTRYSNVKFSSEKPIPYIETSSSPNTNTSLAANYPSAIASKKNEACRLSLALSSPYTQKQAKPLPTASSPPSKPTTSEHMHNELDDDIVSEERDDDDVEMPGPNGSITKMTLENNLLIVETEERNDISRVARETKMDYNKDGVFVVEVARGIDSKTIPESPVAEGNEKMLSMFDTKQNNGGLGYKIANEKNCNGNEKVQVHSPPSENQDEGPRSLHQIEEVEEPLNSPHLNESNAGINGLSYKANTGLSQSDLSTTSSSDSNKGYCYGNQELYVVEQKGHSPLAPNGNVVFKCDIKDIKDDDRNPGNDHYLTHSPDKKEEKEKEDVVETSKKSQEGENRTSSGESPEQKQNDKVQAKNEIDVVNAEQTELMEKIISPIKQKSTDNFSRINENDAKVDAKAHGELNNQTQNIFIPVEIEVHIIPAPVENSTEDETLPSYQAAMEEQSCFAEDVEKIPQPLIPEIIKEDVENSLDDELLTQNNLPVEKQEKLTPNESEFHMVTDNNSNNEIAQDDNSLIENENEKEKENCEVSNEADLEPVEENLVADATENQLQEQIKTVEAQENEPFEICMNSLEINGFSENKEHCQIDGEEQIKTVEVKAQENEPFEICMNSLEINGFSENKVHCRIDGEEQIKTVELKAQDEEPLEICMNSLEINGFSENKVHCQIDGEEQIKTVEVKALEKEPLEICMNSLEINGFSENKVHCQIDVAEVNGLEINKTTFDHGAILEEEEEEKHTLNTQEDRHEEEFCNDKIQPDIIESNINGFAETEAENQEQQLQNGYADTEEKRISLSETENGYDSILNLPEPPPTTDEQLNNDLSEQQLDSLPPPPPPEVFSLKDLPPPLTNGNVDSPQSEESNSFYNTLPPPPPTTLEVTLSAETTTTSNGKVHASPLTPPASPPALFTNNLHAGLCSQPIAVDVNGS